MTSEVFKDWRTEQRGAFSKGKRKTKIRKQTYTGHPRKGAVKKKIINVPSCSDCFERRIGGKRGGEYEETVKER